MHDQHGEMYVICGLLSKKVFYTQLSGLLMKKICEPLIGLNSFFEELCSKELSMLELDILDHQIAVTLCKLE